ncbi:Hypothetical predicted protein, partial [Pelobates cultripes]
THFAKKKRGVSILISKDVAFKLINKHADKLGRFLIIQCYLNNAPYTLVNVYGPHTNQVAFLAKIFQKLDKWRLGEVIMGGDTNFLLDTQLDALATATIATPTELSRETMVR